MKPTLTILFALMLFVTVAGAQTRSEKMDKLAHESRVRMTHIDSSEYVDGVWVVEVPEGESITYQEFPRGVAARSIQSVVRAGLLAIYSDYEKEAYADSVAEKGFWFSDMYVGIGVDRIANANEPGAWWRKWDSMGDLLEQSYKTKAVIRWVHPNAVPPNPFIEFLRRIK